MNLIFRWIPKGDSRRLFQFSLLFFLIHLLHHSQAVNTLFNQSQLEIKTTSGRFIGLSTHLETPHPVTCWLGIPYAEKPIGKLRYKAPIPLIVDVEQDEKKTDGSEPIQTAWDFGDACPQGASPDIPVSISEDCLSLNIYRPTQAPNQNEKVSSDSLLPILVWIHGGGLTYGSSSQYDGSTIVSDSHEMKKPIVVITINYRLNSFGFLSSDSMPVEDLSVGLQDQIAALRWIEVNAISFGGDSKKVTIWGQSAGAYSVGLLMTYLPQSQTLFRAAIMDSGGATSHPVPPVAVYDEPEFPFHVLLNYTGCDDLSKPNSTDPLECLRSLPEETLTNLTGQLTQYGRFQKQIIWNPTYKAHSWIDQRPSKKIRSGHFLQIPVIMGANQDEGTYGAIGAVPGWGDQVDHDFNRFTDMSNPTLKKPLMISTSKNQDLMTSTQSDQLLSDFISNSSVFDLRTINQTGLNQLIQLYPDQAELGAPYGTGNQTFGLPSSFKRLAAWFGDAHYEAPRRLMSSITSSRQNTYVYRFTGPRNSSESSFLGIHHSAEFGLIFNSVWYQDLTDDDKIATYALARRMRRYYINFVHDLQPGKDWPLYKPESQLVMRLDKYNSSIIKDDWRVEPMKLMNSELILDMYSV
ncbi:carboxylesterase [Melampsora americana]|nr:carboxylesterase [Melampsora americana]